MGALIPAAGGMLSKRLAVLTSTRNRTETGGWTDSFKQTSVVDGQITTPRNRGMFERIRGEQPVNAELVEITMRDNGTVATGCRVKDGTNVYELVGVERAGPFSFFAGRRIDG